MFFAVLSALLVLLRISASNGLAIEIPSKNDMFGYANIFGYLFNKN